MRLVFSYDVVCSEPIPLLAIHSGRLANPMAEEEKELLAIGERFGMRGLQIDSLHGQILAKNAIRRSRKPSIGSRVCTSRSWMGTSTGRSWLGRT